MIETEVKVKVEDFSSVEKRLRSLGFKKTKLEQETDVYYEHPSRNLADTQEVLRIRKSKTSTITYKGPLLSEKTKARVEHNVVFDDPETMDSILQSLGFRRGTTIVKSREAWELHGVCVSLDNVCCLGKFVEIERISFSHTADVEEQLLLTLVQLGLNVNDMIIKSYFELAHENAPK